MVPGFNPNEWDRDKIIEWVMDDGPLTDQQLEFLLYFGRMKQELEEMRINLRDANASVAWWQNRFNAVNRQNANLHARISKAITAINMLTTPKRQDNSFHSNPAYVYEMSIIKNKLKGDNNEQIHRTFEDNN